MFMESNCKEGYIHPYEKDLRWTVVLVAPLFGVIAAVCSTGRVGTHTTMVTGHILTLTGSMGNILMLRWVLVRRQGVQCNVAWASSACTVQSMMNSINKKNELLIQTTKFSKSQVWCLFSSCQNNLEVQALMFFFLCVCISKTDYILSGGIYRI